MTGHRDAYDPDAWLQIFGIRYATLDLRGAAHVAAARPASAPFAYVATPNAVHVVGVDRGHPAFVQGIAGAWLRTCDSQVVRLFARLLFGIHLPLAAGSDLTARLFENIIGPDDPICIIGGSVEMLARLRAMFGLRRVTQHIPPPGFIRSADAVAECVAFVQANQARFVFLACGAPQSELLGLRIVEQGGATGLGLCIGASLLFVTGLNRRAPPAWRRLGLEWLHRLVQEPGRMTRRLLTGQLPFIWVAVRDRLMGRRPVTGKPAGR